MNDFGEENTEDYSLPFHKSHFESIFTHTNDAMVFFDTNSKIVRINSRFSEMFGYGLSEVVGRHVNSVVDPLRREGVYGNQKILARETVELEVVRYAKSGHPIQVLLKGGPVVVDGEVTGGYAIYSDITERKKAEDELLRAKAAAEEASRAKGEFLANMSHEIRTPLNGVVSMLSLLDETPLNLAQREYIEMATASAETLLTVINDVLDFSRIEAGKMELSFVTCDLEKEMNLVMSILSSRAREKEVEFLTSYDVYAPRTVVADNLRLRQVLFNLAGNAVKFTEHGHILLEVRQVSESPGRTRLRFSISDTGIGIPTDKLEDIFQHFTQADYSSTRRFGGTGLGLSISRRLVAMMGGEIQVESTVGVGSSFFFELDLPVSSGATFEAPASIGGACALVVDDNRINRTILSEYLRSWRIDAVAVSSGSEALAVLSERRGSQDRFDFALIDYQMPVMDGAGLASLIREDDYWKELPLIAVSSSWTHDTTERLVDSGFWCFLPKPIFRADLLKHIENCVKGCVDTSFRQAFIRPTAKPSLKQLERPPRTESQPVRVLLAEDNDINRRSVQLMLEGVVDTVGVAADGEVAVNMFAEGEFDMILMDVQMPVIDGLEACRRIRQIEASRLEAARNEHRESADRHRPIPIIALTANAMAKDREECLSAGMNDYLSKPLRKGQLLEMISRHLGVEAPVHRPALSSDPSPATGLAPLSASMVFDAHEFMERYDNSVQVAADIMRDALNNLPLEIEALTLHLSQANADGCRRVAHKMKGTLAYIGAARLHRCCQDIIQAAHGPSWPQVESLLKLLRQELESFRPEVEQYFHNVGIHL
ncbi:MAG: response regulator [Spirochaetaceae bacterium]|nr:MAG: response regulator [Spirochaetaceae bacterium]